jgi:preprotein translocase SecE subunit
MKRVHWPPVQETNRLTGVVIAVCSLLVAILALMHLLFHTIIEIITKGF